eukprot:SAG11_NODE_27168_length_336_cov_0.561181_1_plen_36_part_10
MLQRSGMNRVSHRRPSHEGSGSVSQFQLYRSMFICP